MIAVHSAAPAITANNTAKPPAFTSGPNSHTAIELIPKEMARRMPATRERNRSST